MWTGKKGKHAEGADETAFAFASPKLAHPRFDYLCIGGLETLFAALLLKCARPEAFVAVIFTPSEGDMVLPTRLAPLTPDFARPAFAGISPELAGQLLSRLEHASSRVVESFITLDDMAESFYARLIADSVRQLAYLDPFEARHALPALRKDSATWSLEGAYALKGARLFLLDELARALLSALHEAGAVLFNPRGLELTGIEARFAEGGTLPYARLVAADFPAPEAVVHCPAVGVKSPLLSGAALIGEGFYGFSVQRGETLFVGAEGERAAALTARILHLLPGLEGLEMSRSFYLPSVRNGGLVNGLCFDERLEKIASWLTAQGLGGFGALGAGTAAALRSEDFGARSSGEEGINRWYAGQR